MKRTFSEPLSFFIISFCTTEPALDSNRRDFDCNQRPRKCVIAVGKRKVRRGGRICPVDVKSSNRSRDHKSLDDFRRRFGKRLGQSYVIHSKDLSVENGIVYLPAYMAMFV